MRLTVPEAAALLDAPDQRVYDWIEDDSLPAQRVLGQYRINRTELLEWATERGLSLSPRVFVQEQGPQTPPLAVALRAGGIHYGIGGGDLTVAVHRIIEQLPISDPDDREALLHFVIARHDLGLTAVADGIAAPQVRTPAVLAEDQPMMSLSFLGQPLALAGAPRPIEMVFFLVAPTVHAQLTMLAKLTACLKDGALTDALRRRASADEILTAASSAEERL